MWLKITSSILFRSVMTLQSLVLFSKSFKKKKSRLLSPLLQILSWVLFSLLAFWPLPCPLVHIYHTPEPPVVGRIHICVSTPAPPPSPCPESYFIWSIKKYLCMYLGCHLTPHPGYLQDYFRSSSAVPKHYIYRATKAFDNFSAWQMIPQPDWASICLVDSVQHHPMYLNI